MTLWIVPAGLLIVPGLILYVFYPTVLVVWAQIVVRRSLGLRRDFVDAAGERWPFLVGGPEDGEVVVLLHGFASDKESWVFHAARLTKRHRVYIPDLPGFGQHVRRADGDYGVEAQVAYLRAFLRAFGIKRCHLGGHSMGGFIAMKYALAHPEAVASLMLCNTGGVSSPQIGELRRAFDRGENLLALRTYKDVDRLLKLAVVKPILIPEFYKRSMYQMAKADEAHFDRLFQEIGNEAIENPLDDQLGDIRAPTLTIWGRDDRLLDVSSLETLDAIPDHRSAVLDGIGHSPIMEWPEASGSAHRDFIKGLGRRAYQTSGRHTAEASA